MRESEPIALVDMDGSIANFEQGMARELDKIHNPNEPLLAQMLIMNREDMPDWFKARKALIKKTPGFWLGLDPLIEGLYILDWLREFEFSINILTKGPRRSTNAWTEKVEWCQKYVPDALVTITEDKGLVYGKVLFDDWPPYVERWLQWRPRGFVIMLDSHYNQGFEHPNVFRFMRLNPDTPEWRDQETRLKRELQAARER